jgi:hypothetical protein
MPSSDAPRTSVSEPMLPPMGNLWADPEGTEPEADPSAGVVVSTIELPRGAVRENFA